VHKEGEWAIARKPERCVEPAPLLFRSWHLKCAAA
jgi:hypothetical protein